MQLKSINTVFCIVDVLFIHIWCLQGYNLKKTWILEADINFDNVQYLVSQYGLRAEKEILPGFYLLRESAERNRRRSRSVEDVLSIMKHPGVINLDLQKKKKRVLRNSPITFNDFAWNKQWYLNDKLMIPSMNIKKVWQRGIDGDGIVIGVIDIGVDSNHADLHSKQSSFSYDFIDEDKKAIPADKKYNHGTKCAGVAVAVAGNGNCIVGASLKSKYASLRIMDDSGTTDHSEAGSLSHEINNIHIYSNSWGVEDGKGFDGPSRVVNKAIAYGIRKGRNGKGSIYVWAAGNGGTSDNCNCDGYVNNIYTIAISSITSDQYAAYYSEYCSAVLASTYGADDTINNILTTDTNGGCTNFSGTSASAPMASAIIALALQVNPNVTWRDVQHLIVKTSQKHSLKGGSWITNGVGLQVSHLFGYGLMDADLLVSKANTWSLVPCKRICSMKKPTTVEKHTSGSAITSSFLTESCNGTNRSVLYLEHVEIKITFSGTKHGAIIFHLTSPSGTISEILSQRGSDFHAGKKTWSFMSVHFWGENPVGKWMLKMSVPEAGQSGILHYWSLILHGTKTDPSLGRQDEKPCDDDDYTGIEDDEDNDTTTSQNSTKQLGIYIGCGISAFVVLIAAVIAMIKAKKKRSIQSSNKENNNE